MVLEKLRLQDHFTDSEKEIADYILRQEAGIVNMTIREFSDACYASPTAVMRLCKKIGVEGFRDLKVQLIKELEKGDVGVETDVNRPFYIGYSTEKIARTIRDLNQRAMNDAMEYVDFRNLEKAAKILTEAHLIFLYGAGDSSIRARSFMNKLYKINKMCVLATESHEEAGMSMNASAKDAAVMISYRGGQPRFETCAAALKKRGCPIIVLCADFDTPLTRMADIVLKIPDKEKAEDNIATFYSHAAFDYLLNLLYSLVYSNTYMRSHAHKKQIDGVSGK